MIVFKLLIANLLSMSLLISMWTYQKLHYRKAKFEVSYEKYLIKVKVSHFHI